MFQVSKHLSQVSRQVMKIVSVVMLLQFIAPAFITAIDEEMVSDELAYTSQHISFNAPLLLKEREDDDVNQNYFAGDRSLIELLDLSDHASSLNEAHTGLEFFVSSDHYRSQSTHLFTLHRSFLI